jgi:hypothetical protein
MEDVSWHTACRNQPGPGDSVSEFKVRSMGRQRAAEDPRSAHSSPRTLHLFGRTTNMWSDAVDFGFEPFFFKPHGFEENRSPTFLSISQEKEGRV